MYNAITTWVKNNLIDTFASKTESDRDFSKQLQKQYSTYNNTIILGESSTIPEENLIAMDIEICGKSIKTYEAIDKDETESSVNIKLTNEKGDILKHKSSPRKLSKPTEFPKLITKKPVTQRTKLKTDFTYKGLFSTKGDEEDQQVHIPQKEVEEDDDNCEVLDIALPFRTLGGQSSMTNLHSLMKQCPQPQPPFTRKELRTFQLNEDQAYIMKEQMRKMKTGMERLQDMIKKFNCTDKFKQDIDFIVANVGPAIAKAERMKHLQKAPYRAHAIKKINNKN